MGIKIQKQITTSPGPEIKTPRKLLLSREKGKKSSGIQETTKRKTKSHRETEKENVENGMIGSGMLILDSQGRGGIKWNLPPQAKVKSQEGPQSQ